MGGVANWLFADGHAKALNPRDTITENSNMWFANKQWVGYSSAHPLRQWMDAIDTAWNGVN